MAKQNRSLFVPALPPSSPNLSTTSFTYRNNPINNIKQLDRVIEKIAPGYKQDAINHGIKVAKGIGGKMGKGGKNNGNGNTIRMQHNATVPNPDGPMGGAFVVFESKNNSPGGNTSYALSPAPNPKMLKFKSGIKPNTFVNDYMVPMEGQCAPMHMSGITLRIPTVTTNPLYTYFINTVCFDIQTHAQSFVGFSVDIQSTLTTANLLGAFNAAINALQIYFYYSSILSYESDSRNKNAGMINLRQQISSSMLSDLAQLGKRLEDTPLPPRLVEWVRYMMGNYYSSDCQGSPLIKLCPTTDAVVSPASTILISSALNTLTTATNTRVFSLLRRCMPHWRVKTLFDVPTTPIYDKNFMTIFANLPVHGYAPTIQRSNSVTDLITSIPYNSFHNNLDGLAFAMGSVYYSTISDYISLYTPSAVDSSVLKENRVSYYVYGGITAWHPQYATPFLTYARPETAFFYGSSSWNVHLSGSDRCQNVTGNALLSNQQSALDFLFHTDRATTKRAVYQYS